MKHKRLICVQTSIDVEVYIGIIIVLTRSQKVNILNILKVSLWHYIKILLISIIYLDNNFHKIRFLKIVSCCGDY